MLIHNLKANKAAAMTPYIIMVEASAILQRDLTQVSPEDGFFSNVNSSSGVVVMSPHRTVIQSEHAEGYQGRKETLCRMSLLSTG